MGKSTVVDFFTCSASSSTASSPEMDLASAMTKTQPCLNEDGDMLQINLPNTCHITCSAPSRLECIPAPPPPFRLRSRGRPPNVPALSRGGRRRGWSHRLSEGRKRKKKEASSPGRPDRGREIRLSRLRKEHVKPYKFDVSPLLRSPHFQHLLCALRQGRIREVDSATEKSA